MHSVHFCTFKFPINLQKHLQFNNNLKHDSHRFLYLFLLYWRCLTWQRDIQIRNITLHRYVLRYALLFCKSILVLCANVRRYSHSWSQSVDFKQTRYDVVNNSIPNLIKTSVPAERNLHSRELKIRLPR